MVKAISLSKQSIKLSVLLFVQALGSVLAQPVLNGYLTAIERGQMAICMTTLSMTFDILRPGVSPATTYRVAKGVPFFSAALTDSIWAVGILPVVFLTAAAIPIVTQLTDSPVPLQIALLAGLIPAARVGISLSAAFAGNGSFGTVAIGGATGAIALLFLRIILVPNYHLTGALVAEAFSIFLVTLGLGFMAARQFPLSKVTRTDFAETWAYGRKAFGTQVGVIIAQRGLNLVLFPTLGAGLVGTVVAVGILPQTLVSLTALVSRPLFTLSASMDRLTTTRLVPFLSRMSFLVGIASVIALTALTPHLLRVLRAESYDSASLVLFWLTTQVPFRMSASLLGANASGSGRPQVESKSTLGGGLAGILLALLGAVFLGVNGALVGFVLGVIIQWLVVAADFSKQNSCTIWSLLYPRPSDFILVATRLQDLLSRISTPK